LQRIAAVLGQGMPYRLHLAMRSRIVELPAEIAESASDVVRRKPTTGIAGCCACADSDHVATVLPRAVMNSRRLIADPMQKKGLYRLK
jgi:hypothetical protein